MSDYYHITNLRTPCDPTDQKFLNALGDYKLGTPVVADRPNAIPLAEMVQNGIVGLYTTVEALNQPKVLRMTGWDRVRVMRGPKYAQQ